MSTDGHDLLPMMMPTAPDSFPRSGQVIPRWLPGGAAPRLRRPRRIALSRQRTLGSSGVQLHGPPAVPGDHRAVGAVRIAKRFELSRTRHRHVPRQAVAMANPEVAGRPNVLPAELEHEEHLGRPLTDGPD